MFVHFEGVLSNKFDGVILKREFAPVSRKKRFVLLDKGGIGRCKDALEILAGQAL